VFESLFDLKYFLFFIFDIKMIEKHKKINLKQNKIFKFFGKRVSETLPKSF
jgi:hypothetical protein